MRENLLSVDSYNKATQLTKQQGNYYNLIRLFIMEKGTNPLFPAMGIGLRSKYRFINEDDIPELQEESKDQIDTYLPELSIENIDISIDDDRGLTITVSSSEGEDYTITEDNLSSIIVDDE